MKITDLNFSADPQSGLEAIKMTRLDQIVVLAGPNGAGKSRFFRKLSTELPNKLSNAAIKELEQNKDTLTTQLEDHKTELQRRLKKGTFEQTHEFIQKINNDIASFKLQLEATNNRLQNKTITTSPRHANSYQFISFTPAQNTNLADSYTMAKATVLQTSNTINNLGIQSAAGATIPAIQSIQNQWFNASHQHSQLPKEEKEDIIRKYERLVEFVELFIGTKLGMDKDGNATLFGFRAGAAQLSEGQKLLLQFCLALYAQESQLKDIIVWMDEPEKHLHPAALLQVINKLTSVLTNGQLWIATHSINLLSHVPTTSIWYMEHGSISYSGNKPERVLRGLLGDDEAIAKLSNFMTLPEQMAGNQFAFECLFPPRTVKTGSDDPQTAQIISSISDLKNDNDLIKVLDFGAGKGRLLSTINETESSSDIKTCDWLDYIAYDLPSDDEAPCCAHIEAAYGNSDGRYFTDNQRLMESLPKNSTDVIVLCNVFHEIDPKDWLQLFSNHGVIRYLLKETGTLLIVEDQRLPYGEKAYNNGFLVLDKLQFKELFQVTTSLLSG